MKNAIQFAMEHTDINKNNFEVVLHARKSLLFQSNQYCFYLKAVFFFNKHKPFHYIKLKLKQKDINTKRTLHKVET